MESVTAQAIARRPRAFVRVAGPEAETYLQRMVSNDVAALAPGEACQALLLSAKARVIATLVILRRRDEDFLLLTEPELGAIVSAELVRFRFAARAEIELEEHDSYLLLGTDPPEGCVAVPNDEFGVVGWEVLAASPDGVRRVDDDELEAMRIRAGTPRFGREIDDRVLPAEAGLTERAVSFTKGCYPGQEPIARLHYRGHANRGLRRLVLPAGDLPGSDASIVLDGKEVGRVTSSARAEEGVLVLGYVRTEVPARGRTRDRLSPRPPATLGDRERPKLLDSRSGPLSRRP